MSSHERSESDLSISVFNAVLFDLFCSVELSGCSVIAVRSRDCNYTAFLRNKFDYIDAQANQTSVRLSQQQSINC